MRLPKEQCVHSHSGTQGKPPVLLYLTAPYREGDSHRNLRGGGMCSDTVQNAGTRRNQARNGSNLGSLILANVLPLVRLSPIMGQI